MKVSTEVVTFKVCEGGGHCEKTLQEGESLYSIWSGGNNKSISWKGLKVSTYKDNHEIMYHQSCPLNHVNLVCVLEYS